METKVSLLGVGNTKDTSNGHDKISPLMENNLVKSKPEKKFLISAVVRLLQV